MEKRERLEKTFSGESTDRVPVALWRHWPGDDQRAADLAQSIVSFQNTYDWDYIDVRPAPNYLVQDYDVSDEWRGNELGTRHVTRHIITRSLDWTSLRSLDPGRGTLGKTQEAVRLIPAGLDDPHTPLLLSIASPLLQAEQIAGAERLTHDLRTSPDRVHTGLNTLTDNTLRLIDDLRRLPLAGIIYQVSLASYNRLSVAEYETFGLPYDRKVIDTLPVHWWFNMLYLAGTAPMFSMVDQLPVQAVNWHDQDTEPELTSGRARLTGAACGGLSAYKHLHQATPSTIRDAVRTAATNTNARRLILSTGGPIMVTSPWSNIRAVRAAANETGK